MSRRRLTSNAWLVLVMLGALGIRLWSIAGSLPFVYHPDEPVYVTIAQTIFKTGDLNPHFFNYPTLFFYINAAAYVPYYLVGKAVGAFHSVADLAGPTTLVLGSRFAPLAGVFVLSRTVSVVVGVLTVYVAWLGAKELRGARAGLLAGIFVALSASHVIHSRYVTPDATVSLFTLLSVVAALRVLRADENRSADLWRAYVAAGLCIGLTASSKYNGAIVAVALIAAHFLRGGGFHRAALVRLIAAGGVSAAAFLVTTPFALLDSRHFLEDLAFEARHYSTGHPGLEGDSLLWYLKYVVEQNALLYVASAIAVLRAPLLRKRQDLVVAAYAIAYFLFISSFVVRNPQTFLPLSVVMLVLAAVVVDDVLALCLPRVPKLAAVAATTVLLIQPIVLTVGDALHRSTPDSRELARRWINENLPAGAALAMEAYAPHVDGLRFRVTGFRRLIDQEAGAYRAAGFEYLVFARDSFGRFYDDPARYSAQIAQYDSLFETFELVRTFAGDAQEIRLYRVRR